MKEMQCAWERQTYSGDLDELAIGRNAEAGGLEPVHEPAQRAARRRGGGIPEKERRHGGREEERHHEQRGAMHDGEDEGADPKAHREQRGDRPRSRPRERRGRPRRGATGGGGGAEVVQGRRRRRGGGVGVGGVLVGGGGGAASLPVLASPRKHSGIGLVVAGVVGASLSSRVLALRHLTFLSSFLRGGFGINVRFKETSCGSYDADVRDHVSPGPSRQRNERYKR